MLSHKQLVKKMLANSAIMEQYEVQKKSSRYLTRSSKHERKQG